MAEPEESQEQEFEVLEALAKISARDFRLGQFMADIGLDPNQPVIFYRRLISEAREFKSLVDILEQNIDTDHKVIKRLKADLAMNEERVRTLTTKLHTLQNGTHQKTESLEKERQGLLATTSELQAKVLRYDALIQLLKGEIEPTTLKALSNMFWDTYSEIQHDTIAGRPPPDPARLDKICQKLRQDFRDILHIPKQELEQEIHTLRSENKKLKGQIDAMVNMLRNLYGGGGIEGAG